MSAPAAAKRPEFGRLERRGWEPVIGTLNTPAGSVEAVCQPHKADTFALVSILMSPEAAAHPMVKGIVGATLGETPFQVEGADGGILWVYRWAGKPQENQTWRLASGGRLVVTWGGQPVPVWPDPSHGQWLRHPAAFGPDDLPEVNDEGVTAMVDAVHALAPIDVMADETAAAANGRANDGQGGPRVDISPVGRLAVPWRVDAKGKVVAGLRPWIRAVARHHVAFGDISGRERLEAEVRRNAVAAASERLTERHRDDIATWISEMVAEAIAAGRRAHAGSRSRPKLSVSQTPVEISPYEPEWLADLAHPDTRSNIATTLGIEPALRGGFDEVGLDRTLVRESLGTVVDNAIDGFLADVAAHVGRVRVLIVPPGVGKTTRTLARLLFGHTERPRGPIGFMSPNYENISEIRERIAAADTDICWLPVSDDEGMRRARSPNILKVMTFAGRIHAGCRIPDKMALAMEIGQGASLCRARTPDGDDVVCPHYATCPAILQRQQVGHADLVLMPHQFLTTTMPAELAALRGIVIDERTDNLLMGSVTVPLDEITAPRRRIKTTKLMRAEGVSAETLMAARQSAWEEVAAMIDRGADPVFVASTDPEIARLFRHAHAYCSALSNRDLQVSPLTPIEALRDAAERPLGRHLIEEQRFWSILVDDIQANRLGSARIKWVLLEDSRRGIRISWREAPNWQSVPKLLLDGSASAEVIGRLWPVPAAAPEDQTPMLVEHRSREHEISVNALLPTLLIQTDDTAKSAVLPRGELSGKQALRAAQTVARFRRMLSILAGRNADGRVLVGGMKAVISTLRDGWTPPANMDFCHYGALRGLNIYERHKLAISVGRLELPPDVIEGLACSLGYDDPEWPGPDPEQTGIAAVPVVMRDGRRLSIPSPVAADRWSRAIQSTSREEELRQFAGRLRAVQRVNGSYPEIAWVVIGNVVPENTVLDTVLGSEDLLADRFAPLFEVARRTGGIIPCRSCASWIDDLPIDPDDLAGLLAEFSRNRTIRRGWRVIEREVDGIGQEVFVARHLDRTAVDEVFASLEGFSSFSALVAGLDFPETGRLESEVGMYRDVLEAARFNPEAEADVRIALSPGGLPLAINWAVGDLGETPLWIACAGGAIARNLAARQ